MSSTSVEQTKTTAQDGFGSAGTPPPNTRLSAAGDRLYRVVWRWHFDTTNLIEGAPEIIALGSEGLGRMCWLFCAEPQRPHRLAKLMAVRGD